MLMKLSVEIATGGNPAQAIAKDPPCPGWSSSTDFKLTGQHISGKILDHQIDFLGRN